MALILLGILAPAAPAQPTANLPVVAILCSFFCFSPETMPTRREAQAFLGALRDAGFVDGKTVVLDLRASGVAGDLPRAAAAVARRRPAVILATGDDAVRAARRATAEIPIVMLGASDPVETGIVASLGRPGGNVTGVGVSIQTLAARGTADFDGAFAAIGPVRPAGLVVLQEDAFIRSRGELTRRALAGRIPMVANSRFFVQAAALLAYGPSSVDMSERAGALVARVLRGERPGDLPVEEPTRYELFLNLSTAKALGLTVPQSMLAQVDEVFQ